MHTLDFSILLSVLLAPEVASILRGPADVVARKGEQVALRCSATDDRVRWARSYSKDDDVGQVIYGGHNNWNTDRDEELYDIQKRGNGTVDFVIRNATANDAAWYFCYQSSLNMGRAFVIILDDSSPRLVSVVTKSNSVEHRCQFKYAGLLIPTVEWIGQRGEVMEVTRTDNKTDDGNVESSIIAITTFSKRQWPKTCRVVFTSTNGSRLRAFENDNDLLGMHNRVISEDIKAAECQKETEYQLIPHVSADLHVYAGLIDKHSTFGETFNSS